LVQMAVKTASQLAANQEILDQYQALIEAMIASGKSLTNDFVDKVNAEMDRIINATEVMHNAAVQLNADGLKAIQDCATDASVAIHDQHSGFAATRTAANDAETDHNHCRSDEMTANETLTQSCDEWYQFSQTFSLPCTDIPRDVESQEGYEWLKTPPPEGLPVDAFWDCLNRTEEAVMGHDFVAAMDPHSGSRHRCIHTEMAHYDGVRSVCNQKQRTFETKWTDHISHVVHTCDEQTDCRNRTAESHHEFCERNEGDIEARKRQFHSANNIKCYVGALALMGNTADNGQAAQNTNAKDEILKCKSLTYDVTKFDMSCDCDANNMQDCPAEPCDSSDAHDHTKCNYGSQIWHYYADTQPCTIAYPSQS